MDINLLLGATGVLGMGAGVWALVFYRKNGNGRHDPWQHAERLAKEFGPVQQQASAPVQVQWPPELAALLTHITERLETAIERVEHPLIVREPSEQPEWVTPLLEELQDINERMSEPASMVLPPELAAGLNRVTDRLESLLQVPPPEMGPPPLVQIAPELERRLDKIIQQVGLLLSPTQYTQPPNPTFTPRGPAARAPNPVNLSLFNTIILQDNELTELIPPEQHVYVMSVFNLGAGTVFIKNQDDLQIDDPLATTVPAGSGDNGIPCPVSLFVIAEDGCKVSIRLSH